MIVRTSAKSRLIRPGFVIRSQIPWTPWRSTSSAIRNASSIDVDLSSTSSSRSFGITISVSQLWRSSLDALVGLLLAARALELERRRDDADGERAELARDPRDDRRRAGAGAAALAGGDEDHVRAAQRALDLVVALLGGAAADLGVGAGAEALGELAADVELRRRVAHLELLDVGVDRDEVDLRDPGVDHPVERVQAGAADADDADHREVGRALAGALEARRVGRERLEPARGGPVGLRLGRSISGSRVGQRRRGRRRLALAARRQARGARRLAACAALGRLGRAEELRERALTHLGAISRHGAPPLPGRGTARQPRPRARRRARRSPYTGASA